MDFKQLEAFVKVYELKNFSKAAESIFISQPSVSAHISALEKEMNVRLINRSTKDVSPTSAGTVFYEHAKGMLALKKKSILSLKRLTDCDAGDLEIIASSVPAQYILPEMLSKFHKIYPNIVFHISQTDTSGVIKGISEQRAEIGFTGAKKGNPKCVFEYLTPDKLIIIAPCDMASKYKTAEDIFYNESFIMREQGSGTRMIYEEFFKKAGINKDKLKISAYQSDTQSIINAVSCGLGFSIVSELAARHYLRLNMVTKVDVDCPLPEREFYLVLNKDVAIMPAADVFIKFVRDYYYEENNSGKGDEQI